MAENIFNNNRTFYAEAECSSNPVLSKLCKHLKCSEEKNSISTMESEFTKQKIKMPRCTRESQGLICFDIINKMKENSKICQNLINGAHTHRKFENEKENEKELDNLSCFSEKKDSISNSSQTGNFFFNKDFLTLDAFGFGMGFNCVQVTFSSRNITEARYVYDSFAVLGSIFLAQTASTSVVDSTLIDWDARWRLIEQSTDARDRSHYVRTYSTHTPNINFLISEISTSLHIANLF